jgi:hypothetical protein
VHHSVTRAHVNAETVEPVNSSVTATPVVVALVDVLKVISSDPSIAPFKDRDGSHDIAPKKYGRAVAMRVTIVAVRVAGEASGMR